jgi:signal transduction histidine kinase
MINTFLSVTQLQRKDKQEVLKIPLRLDEVVRETIASLQPVAKKKRIRFIEQPAHRIPPVAADKSLITQGCEEPRQQRDQVQSGANYGHGFNCARS